MQYLDDAELECLPLKELQKLRMSVDEAIRAAIRASRPAANVTPPGPGAIDLERERDAWQARSKIDGRRSAF
jgi:hypothetical protein